MDEFLENKLEPLDVDKHLVKRQNMYFGSDGATAERICTNIAEGALILGAVKVQIQKVGDWHLICGSPDWFGVTEIPFRGSSDLFEHVCGFPEAGVNSCRFEVMVRIFSRRVFLFGEGKLEAISGVPLESNELKKILHKAGEWSRIIGFQFEEKKV